MNLVVVIALASSLAGQATVQEPEGYRIPGDAERSGDWEMFRKEFPEPYVVRADFNDGFRDEVWLLPANNGGFGLFAFLGTSTGLHRVVPLERDDKEQSQWYGVTVARPGPHKTACGKGYWECKDDEPTVLTLELPGIEFSGSKARARSSGGMP